MVADIEVHARKLNAKEVLTPQRSGNFKFPVADGTVKILVEKKASENIRFNLGASGTRRRTRILQGKSDELHSPTQLQDDSKRDDEEAKCDFWTITWEFIYRHHVVPRVKLYVPREESFPIPLKYIDVTRTTYVTGRNVGKTDWRLLERGWRKRTSDAWKGFTRFVLLKGRIYMVQEETYKKTKKLIVMMSCGQICGNLCPMQQKKKSKAKMGYRETKAR